MTPRSSFRIEGSTRHNRHDVLAAVSEAVSRCGGWIASSQLFSNTLAALNVALPAGNLGELAVAVAKAGVTLHAPAAVSPQAENSSEIMGQIVLTFLHNEPDLRHEVPAVG